MTSISPNAPIVYLRNPNAGNYNYSIDNVNWFPVVLPLTISNPNAPSMMKVVFTTDFTMTSTSHYFICGSGSLQFGEDTGIRPVITIDGVTDYPGLIKNGVASPGAVGYDDVYVMNLAVTSSSSTIADGSGWIGWLYFARGAANNRILYCSSDGPIPGTNSGGIVGIGAAADSGNLLIVGCSSTGTIGENAGGITGPFCAVNSGIITITECYTTGEIGDYAGGIIGVQAGSTNGTVTITKCYSAGAIVQYGGGITGAVVGDTGGSVTINSCYSTGNIGGKAGGIVGDSGQNATITNCYSTGSLDTQAGGIVGFNYQAGVTASHCYTSGTGAGSGIYSGNPDGLTNYSEKTNGSSGWNSSHANTVLQNVGTTTWIEVVTNTPYELINFGASPYTLSSINGTKDGLTHSYSQTVQAGNSADPSVYPVYTSYSILQSTEPTITIDNATGIISTTNATPPAVYTFLVRASYNPYTITTFVLTVTGGGPLPPVPTEVAAQETIPHMWQNIHLPSGNDIVPYSDGAVIPAAIPSLPARTFENIHLKSGNDIVPYSVGAVIPAAIPPIPARTIQNIKLPNGPKDVACNTAARCHPIPAYRNVPNPTEYPSNPGQKRICNIQPPRKVSGTALQQYQPGYGTYTVTYNRPSGSKVAGTWPPPSNK